MKLFKFTTFLSLVGVISLTSCGNKEAEREFIKLDNPDDLITTYYTDKMKLNLDYENKVFTKDGIGLVKLRSNTDGDTAKFYDTNSTTNFFPVRFLGVNTPESTGAIEPRGKKASVFVASILNKAAETGDILLVNDKKVFGEKDSSGNRYLAFVWYRFDKTSDFRCLNLEIIEQGFSRNQLFVDSTICPYRETFEAAEKYAQGSKLKVFSKDPGYDYSDNVVNTSIAYLKEHYDELGVTEESSGKKLNITATVIGQSADNLYLRDVKPDADAESDKLESIYCFSGYGKTVTSMCQVGDYINFYCRAGTFLDAIQLTDLEASTLGTYKFTNLTRLANTEITESTRPSKKEEILKAREEIKTYVHYDQENDFNVLDDVENLSELGNYQDTLVSGLMTIRTVNNQTDDDQDEGSGTGEEYYYKKDQNNNMTVYSTLNFRQSSSPLYINMRVEGGSNPYPGHELFQVGKTYRVKGFLKPYYDKYQIALFNNRSTETFKYIEEVNV